MKCSFCKKVMAEGTGKMFVFKSGKVNYFCSSKCERNMINLGRKPRLFKWTGFFEKARKGPRKAGSKKPRKK